MTGSRVRALGAACVAILAVAMVIALPAPDAGAVTSGVKPDFVLAPGVKVRKHITGGVLINDLSPQAADTTAFTDWAARSPTPDQCRTPAYDAVCDVYRFKLKPDPSPDALNFVRLDVSWDRQASTPDLVLAVAGLGASDLPDLDLFLYAKRTEYMDYELVGGRGASIPERLAWDVTQDEYDLVVRAGTGVALDYEITAQMSNEIFDKPFELLDDVGQAVGDEASNVSAPVDRSGDAAPIAIPGLALAPLGVDNQIAAIGLGTEEHFDPVALGGHAVRAAAVSEPPSAIALILGMLLFPAAMAGAVFVVLKRRRAAFST
jgi:hypothetical protein